jgi:hypothetical protein
LLKINEEKEIDLDFTLIPLTTPLVKPAGGLRINTDPNRIREAFFYQLKEKENLLIKFFICSIRLKNH